MHYGRNFVDYVHLIIFERNETTLLRENYTKTVPTHVEFLRF